jgi:hypothetical protein
MRTGAGVIALTLFGFAASSAAAQEWYTGARSTQPENTFGAAVDASLAGTSQGALHGVMIGTIAPFTKLNESGMRLRLGGLLGSYSYTSSAPGVGDVTGREAGASFMGGYEWRTRNSSIAFYLGGDVQNRSLSKPDPSNNVVGMSWGFKTALDFYMNPTAKTMVSANLTYSTVNSSFYSRFKGGYAMMGRIFVGPEILILGDSFYQQFRVGAHLTGVQLGAMQFGVSGGFVQDKKNGAGAYGILDARVGF